MMKGLKRIRGKFAGTAAVALLLAAVSVLTLISCSKSGRDGASSDKTLYNATQNDYPPFIFVNENNELVGFEADFIKEIDARLEGYTIVQDPSGWDAAFIALDSGRVDMVCDQVAIIPERTEKYLFTTPYFEATNVIVVKKGRTDIHTLDDLAGKTVIGNASSDNFTLILENYNKTHGPDRQINILYQQITVAATPFVDVAEGKADAYVNDGTLTYAIIKELGLDLEVVGDTGAHENIAIVLPSNENGRRLKALLDPIIEGMIGDGTMSRLSTRWLDADFTPSRK
jgi:L-cystine transport system substrate-binding protein